MNTLLFSWRVIADTVDDQQQFNQDSTSSTQINLKNLFAEISDEDIVEALETAKISYRPSDSEISESRGRIYAWAIRNKISELKPPVGFMIDYRAIILEELVFYLEPKPIPSGGSCSYPLSTELWYNGGLGWDDKDWDILEAGN